MTAQGETAGDHASEKVYTEPPRFFTSYSERSSCGLLFFGEPSRRRKEFLGLKAGLVLFHDLWTIIENQPLFEYNLFINRPVFMAKDGMK